MSASAPGAGSPSAAAPPERRTINLGVVNFSALYWPVYVGIAEGLYDRAGFDVELVVTRSGPDGLAALMGGSLEAVMTNGEVLVLAQSRGADVIGVASLTNHASYTLMVQPEIQRVATCAASRWAPRPCARVRRSS